MSTHRALNWAIAACIALLMACSYLLDGPSDVEAAQAVADDLQDATKTVAAPAQSTGSNVKNAIVFARADGVRK